MNCLNKSRFLVGFVVVLLAVLTYGVNEYYTSALNAYASEKYEQALQWFEKAIQIEPSLESYDNLLKLKMGICAFAIGDLQKAKAYLEPYERSNPIAAKILDLIRRGGQPTEEWMVWIRSRVSQTTSTVTSQEPSKEKRLPLFLVLGVFTLSFSLTFLAVYFLRKRHKRTVAATNVEEPTVETLEAKVENSIGEVEKLIEEISVQENATTVAENDEKLKEIEAQLDSIVQEILSKEQPKQTVTLSSQEDPFEILKKLEEKNAYDEEDAKILSDLMQKIINTPERSEDERER
ncbi:tetratricopeptide repeat protein [Pseudothermotoga sp. U03pept]|uniref:tetratricopeptide repeat protein n=1 Tax=Pseudothermotoga sp. U03pept TaxID=3447012 RepID=UPI003F03A278